MPSFKSLASAALALAPATNALMRIPGLNPRQLPADAPGVTTITSPTGVQIRYKEPGKEGLCETTPGVNSYSGYIDISPTSHTFFWFFESRSNPSTDQVTLWLNGGPGSDSLIGLFEELGPCMVAENLTTYLNPYGWNGASNLLFLSQPVGTGFSYSEEEPGSYDPVTGGFLNATQANVTGRWPVINAEELDTTELSAVAAFHILQGFYSALPQLDCGVDSREFNLWTESYGGHYGPAFFDYFYQQNMLISNGTINGTKLIFNTLGIGNGIINERIQAPYYPDFAMNNTYGIKAYNDTVYNYAKFAYYMINGCRDQIDDCAETDQQSFDALAICTEAADMCRDNVESPYYQYAGRGTYDIRHWSPDPTPYDYFIDMLNIPSVQAAIGVNLNYTDSNDDIYWAFQETGDFIYNDFLHDLEYILDQGVRVSMYYGDADYICNWFGGEAVSLQVNYTHSDEFRQTDYELMEVDGTAYGEVRQYGNFSFLRVWEAGHEVPFYQPVAAYALFNRTINHFDVATGTKPVTADLQSEGEGLTATHSAAWSSYPSPTPTGDSSAQGRQKKQPIIPRAPKPQSAPRLQSPAKAKLAAKRAHNKRSNAQTSNMEKRRPGATIGQRFSKPAPKFGKRARV